MYARAQLASASADRALREPALFVLAILLMFSFSMFPRGYMPARTASGFTIVLCSASGLVGKSVDSPIEVPKRHVGSVKCDMIGAAAVLPPPVTMTAPSIAPIALSLWTIRAFALESSSAFDPNAPPTAPPLPAL